MDVLIVSSFGRQSTGIYKLAFALNFGVCVGTINGVVDGNEVGVTVGVGTQSVSNDDFSSELKIRDEKKTFCIVKNSTQCWVNIVEVLL